MPRFEKKVLRADTRIVHVVSFIDHSSRPARMVFKCEAEYTLPPLYGFIFYFTHPKADPETIDLVGFHDGIFRGSGWDIDRPLRLDMHFLPGAGPDECIAQYRAEKAVRGVFTTQIQKYKRIIACLGEPRPQLEEGNTQGALPGFVSSYAMNPDVDVYNSMLFLCEAEDWCEDPRLRQIEFDPEDGAIERLREEGETSELGPTYESSVTIGCFEEGMPAGETITEAGHYGMRDGECNEAWYGAARMGWTSW